MTWTAIAGSAFSAMYFVDNDYVLRGYVEETWAKSADDDVVWTDSADASETWT